MKNIPNKILKKLKESYYIYFKSYKDITKKRNAFADIFENEVKNNKNIWPNGKLAAFNLQFDDFSVKHKGNSEYDYGGNPDSKICREFKNLFVKYPYLKTTIFTIPNPKFVLNNMFNHKSHNEDKYKITNKNYTGWLSWVKSREFTKNNEIAIHGLYHCQHEIKNVWPFLEFEFKNESECENALKKSKKLFDEVGIKISGFKPPAWGIGVNSDYSLIKVLKKECKNKNFKYCCLSSPVSGLNWEKKKVSNFFPAYYEGILNIPQNINMLWPLEKIKEIIDFSASINGVIIPQLHFIEEGNWMDDGIGENSLKKLDSILEYLNTRYKNKIWFAKAEEIATAIINQKKDCRSYQSKQCIDNSGD